MKIIGEKLGGFILEISEHDLKKLAGFRYRHDKIKLVVGAEINIGSMFDALDMMNDKKNNTKKAIKDLREQADSLEEIITIDPFVSIKQPA